MTETDGNTFVIMFEDINTGDFVKSEPIMAGGSAANITAAIAPYYNSITGTDPTGSLQCYDDLDQEKDCAETVRYDHHCPDNEYLFCETCRASVGGADIDCLDASATVCVIPGFPLSETTSVAGISWSNLKIGAADAGYGTTAQFAALSAEDKALVTLLISE